MNFRQHYSQTVYTAAPPALDPRAGSTRTVLAAALASGKLPRDTTFMSTHPVRIFQAWAVCALPPEWLDDLNGGDFKAVNALAQRAGFRAIGAEETIEASLSEFIDWWTARQATVTDVVPRELDPDKFQSCCVSPVDPVKHPGGQPCCCPLGTCALRNGGRLPPGGKAQP